MTTAPLHDLPTVDLVAALVPGEQGRGCGEDLDLQKLTGLEIATNEEDRQMVEKNQAGFLQAAE